MKTQSSPTLHQPKDGGYAFPLPDTVYPSGQVQTGCCGMTLRDWFAGHAMAVMTAAPDYSKGPCNAAIAERAYIIADAMIAEREKVNGP